MEAQSLASTLTLNGQTDETALLTPALDPFGQAPSAASSEGRIKLRSLEKESIATKAAALRRSYKKDTDAISQS
jgi:hypothetical protein